MLLQPILPMEIRPPPLIPLKTIPPSLTLAHPLQLIIIKLLRSDPPVQAVLQQLAFSLPQGQFVQEVPIVQR